MKTFSDRIWLVLLGIAVAIVVMLTTFYWNKPAESRSTEKLNPAGTSHNRAVMPRLASDMIKSLSRSKLSTGK